jgi:hypothetical protein
LTFFPLKKKRGGSTFVFVDFFALKRFLNFFSPLKKKSSFVCSCYLPEFALNFFFVPFFFFLVVVVATRKKFVFQPREKEGRTQGKKKPKAKTKI